MAFSHELSELLSKCNSTAEFTSHIRNHFSRSGSCISDLSALRGQSFLMQSQYASKKDPIYNSWQSCSPEMTALKCAWSISMMSWISGIVHNSGLWVTLLCCPTLPVLWVILCRFASAIARVLPQDWLVVHLVFFLLRLHSSSENKHFLCCSLESSLETLLT